ncbi:MAG: AraC family transcriptional regulator, partial [Roseburia sp.]
MAEKQIKENYLDFYLQNSDWESRTVVDSFETNCFQKDSTIRIWYNEQNENYDTHWHNALEIIMPVENHY